MTLYEFRMLEQDQHANAVWDGVFIDSRPDGEGSVALYDLGGFYVEVFYDNVNNKITVIKAFKTTKMLAPYLDSFNSEDLDELGIR
jgi:hypothetical protein